MISIAAQYEHFHPIVTKKALPLSHRVNGPSLQEGVYIQGVGVCIQGNLHPMGVGWDPLIPVNRMTDRCENITLPQTSFAGGNN